MSNVHGIAVVARGLEDVTAREIRALGGGMGKTRKDRGRVTFQGPADALMRANLLLRTADRILAPAGKPFDASSALELTRGARELPWERWIGDRPVRVAASVRACRLYHTGAIEDAIREALVYRGLNVPTEGDEAATIDVRGTANRWTLAVDSTGGSLHRRGYRKATARAPLRETLAAACLLRMEWSGDVPLLDPMCGSGTFVGEAASLAAWRPPGLDRTFAFEQWPSFDPAAWEAVVGRAVERIRPLPAAIEGGDVSPTSVKAARGNLERLDVPGVSVHRRRLEDTPPDDGPGVIIANPPYGKRISPGRELAAAQGEWRAWAAKLAELRPNQTIYLLSPDQALAEAAGAEGRPLLRFSNGGIPVALVRLTR